MVGIKKLNAKIYIGFIIKADPNFWKPDKIKFRLFSDCTYEYYMLDRSVQKGKYTIDNGAFFLDTSDPHSQDHLTHSFDATLDGR